MMLIAIVSKRGAGPLDPQAFQAKVRLLLGEGAATAFPAPGVALALAPHPASQAAPAVTSGVATGVLFEHPGLPGGGDGSITGQAASLLTQLGPGFARDFHGHLACVLFEPATATTTVVRDHLGVEPLYWADHPDVVVIASRAPHVAALLPDRHRKLDPTALARILCFNYNPGSDTIWAGVRKFPPGHFARIANGTVELTRYWRLDYSRLLPADPEAILPPLREALTRAVTRRAASKDTPGVFVSGGLDSSTTIALLARVRNDKPLAFSYRCKSQSFDESHYARLMASSVGAPYDETVYSPEDVALAAELVGDMSEPFCDSGINMATALVGRAASRKTSVVLTGDGGDELFGGHPVYEADKVAVFTDRIPLPLARAVGGLLSRLPDSDKKKTLGVKLKRFGESLSFPRELLTNRWRLYYSMDGLHALLSPELSRAIDPSRLFADIVASYEDAGTDDLLGRVLYSDYFTVVDSYLRRNDLNRALGIEMRYPMFDVDLMELCARIPSSLKIRGWFDSKYIMKPAIEPWLPHEIVHRKDKLGHSIPMKNWLRGNSFVREFARDLLSKQRLERRGLFDPAYVRRLWDEHDRSRANHAHRLWLLAVMELWLDRHFGDAAAG